MSTTLRHFLLQRPTWAGPLALSLAALAATVAGATEPSQSPLTSSAGAVPPPNVMITIDDSGSMLFDAMPEGAFTLNGYSVTVFDQWAGAFPGDPRKRVSTPQGTYNYEPCVAPAEPTARYVYQMQFRSPDVNTIYYNPDIHYLPWVNPTPNGSGVFVRRGNIIDATRAPWDPAGLVSGTYNLVTTKTITGGTWCTDARTIVNDGQKSRQFAPGLVYRLKAGADPTKTSSYTAYNVNATNGSHAPAVSAAGRDDCRDASGQQVKCTQKQELQNFANWFSYYRMREFMAKAAISESFTNFKDQLRAGWGRINKTSASTVEGGGSASFKVIELGVAQLDANWLGKVLTGVQSIESTGGTPLRTAVDAVGGYFYNRKSDAYSPWATVPGATTAPGNERLACRRSVNVLTTDGYYNDDYTAAGDLDTSTNTYSYPYSSTNPGQNPNSYTPYQYVPGRPYSDAPKKYSNTLADAAMRWYIRDLDTSIANNITPVDGDIAFWQHLSQFTVGIGVKGTLDASTDAAKASTLAQLANGTIGWPDPLPSQKISNPEKIDDLWHAAVNTGGDFASAKNVTELTNALSNAFGKAVGNDGREAGVATVASTLVQDNIKFVPTYRSGAWTGDVLAYRLDTNGSVLGGANAAPVWQASKVLPDLASRNLFTWSGSSPEAFSVNGLSTSDKSLIVGSSGFDGDALVNYIRGDTSNEGAAKTFRSRGGQLLGDFINSPPVYVKNLVNLGYDKLSDTTWNAGYAGYLAQKAARSEGVVAVGANAGIFHLFRGSDGKELFGYVPRVGFPNLSLVASKTYGTTTNYHHFFVDGPTVESDAYITPQGESSPRWTNVLVGGMGAGGRGVFALNLATTDPTGALGSNTVQWELTDNDLGYVQGDMRVGPIQGGKLAGQSGWYAFIGNGPYSANGRAALLVVDVQTGSVVKSIQVPTGTGNGLGGVYLLRNSHQEVYAAYAGDLLGNLWRFDFTDGTDTSTWKVSFGGAPLFTAQDGANNVQPITAAPIVMAHPTQGYVVLFGTGKLFDAADATSTGMQSFYGVWDSTARGAAGGTVSPFNGVTAPQRNVLVQQTIDTEHPVTVDQTANGKTVTNTYYKLSSNAVDWTVRKGWYLDLNIMAGQRVVYAPQSILSVVYFSSIVPAAPAAMCESNVGTGYNFIVDAVSGAALTSPVFDTNGDGVVNGSDTVVAGMKSTADGIDKLLSNQEGVVGDQPNVTQCLPDPGHKCGEGFCLTVIVNTSNEAEELCVPGPPRPAGNVITDRVWRQILNPPTP